MKTYYVEGYSAWFLVNARNNASARSEGIHSYNNVAVSHPICNQMKMAKTSEEYKKWLENLKR